MVNGLEITVIYTDREDDERTHHLRMALRAARAPTLLAEHGRIHRMKSKSNRSRDKSVLLRNAARPRTGRACAERTAPRFARAWPPIPMPAPTDAQFWKTAEVVMPARKQIVTMRLDADLLRWFRRERGYQTRINAIRPRLHARPRVGLVAWTEPDASQFVTMRNRQASPISAMFQAGTRCCMHRRFGRSHAGCPILSRLVRKGGHS